MDLATTREAAELQELRSRLAAAEEMLRAIATGQVDAVVVDGSSGPEVYTLRSAAEPYRLLVEQMAQGALTATGEGIILYCNATFARMLGRPRERLVGTLLSDHVAPAGRSRIAGLLAGAGEMTGEISFATSTGGTVEALVSAATMAGDDEPLRCLAITDLSDQVLRRQYTAVVEAAEDAIYVLDPDLTIRTWNRGAELQSGLSAAEAVGRDERELWPGDRHAELAGLAQRCAGEKAALTVEIRRRRKNGSWADLIYTLTALHDREGAVSCYCVVAHDITERKAAEHAIAESEKRLRRTLESIADGFIAIDREWRITLVNSRAEQTILPLGKNREDLIGKVMWDVFPDLVGSRLDHAYRRAMREQTMQSAEIHYPPLDRWFHVRAYPSAEALLIYFLDVTPSKLAERHRELLIDELNHRVKNTLAIVQGVAHQTFRSIEAAEPARLAFEGRLASIAGAHNLLTREKWERVSLRDLASEAVQMDGANQGRIRLDGAPVILEPRQAVSIAMALHELTTNAMKYGALSGAEGSVELSWRMDRRLQLVWRERGGPAVIPPGRRGFGSRMIQDALAHELDGRVSMDFQPEGLVCTIDGAVKVVA